MALKLSNVKILNYKSINDISLDIENMTIVILLFLLVKIKRENLTYLMQSLLFQLLPLNLIMMIYEMLKMNKQSILISSLHIPLKTRMNGNVY